jgi:ribonuclease MRP protein subunit RMP1
LGSVFCEFGVFFGSGLVGMWLMIERAFSGVVADNQYSALGLTLLGSLARVRSVMGMLVEDGEEGVTEAEVEGETLSKKVEIGDDFGEVVDREEILGTLGKPDADEKVEVEPKQSGEQEGESSEEKPKPTVAKPDERKQIQERATPSKPPKKKRKKGDAFDDLFSSLI